MNNSKRDNTIEITFTMDDIVVYEEPWDYDELPGIEVPYLHHYRSGSSIENIFRNDGIYLRFTRGDSFPDKMEGKAIEVYYDLAIEDLLDQGKITAEQYQRIIGICPPHFMFTHEERNGIDFFTRAEFTPYIICFSTIKDDPHMYNLVKDTNTSGKYSFSMDTTVVSQLTQLGSKNDFQIKLRKILYGKSVVEYIQQKVLYMLKNPPLYSGAEAYLREYLHRLQFMAKLSKYKGENEVRMIVKVPKHHNSPHPDFFFEDDEKYLFLKIPKSFVFKITPQKDNDKSLDDNLLSTLNKRGYSYA